MLKTAVLIRIIIHSLLLLNSHSKQLMRNNLIWQTGDFYLRSELFKNGRARARADDFNQKWIIKSWQKFWNGFADNKFKFSKFWVFLKVSGCSNVVKDGIWPAWWSQSLRPEAAKVSIVQWKGVVPSKKAHLLHLDASNVTLSALTGRTICRSFQKPVSLLAALEEWLVP